MARSAANIDGSNETRVLVTYDLMERICEPSNLNQAFRRVKQNKGSAGVDRLTIQQAWQYLKEGGAKTIRKQLIDGTYQPQPIRGVKIPKSDGGERQLGIPTVIDRWIQQAMQQVLTDIYDPNFSDSSFGFRPKRSAHDAIKQSSRYIATGRSWVVDVDLEKYFDTVNHDRLMQRLSQDITDKRVLSLIRRFLQAGLMQDGLMTQRQQGTPQGGPLSPLLSNLVLDELDKELEKRGHTFSRYADDCNIYVRSREAGERVLKSMTHFLEKRLKLKVNTRKSACDRVSQRQFLGYRFNDGGQPMLSPKTKARVKRRIREITRRNRGRALSQVIRELSAYLKGWLHYFKLSKAAGFMQRLDEWIRRRLRCYRLKQRKRSWPIAKWLKQMGVKESHAWQLAKSSKGWWRMSRNPVINQALPNKWFEKQGLYSLRKWYELLHVKLEPPYAMNACTVV